MAAIEYGRDGLPVLLAEPSRRKLEENRTEIVTPDTTSGPAEWGRYSDAVRECARSFDNPEEGDVRQFLDARARNPERVDAGAFHEAVKRQRMADLVDIVDHHMRRDGSLPRGSRHIRTQAPKGFLKRSLRQSSPEELAHLRHRLTAIGHEEPRVDEFLSSRVSDDNWDQAKVFEIEASDSEFEGLTFDAADVRVSWDDEDATPWQDVLDMVESIRNQPPPIVNVYIDNQKRESE